MPADARAFMDGPLAGDSTDAKLARAALEKLLARPIDIDKHGVQGGKVSKFRLKSSEPLFEYQKEVVTSLKGLFSDGHRRAMVSLPTGGGKTRTAIWFFRGLLEGGEAVRVLWVAPTVELVNQAVAALKQLWGMYNPSPSLDVIVNDVGSTRESRDVCGTAAFATTQRAARNLQGIRSYEPDLLIFDEAHQAAARTCREIVRTVAKDTDGNVVGMSATPGRRTSEDSDFLAEVFDRNLVMPRLLGPDPVNKLREWGVLSELERREIELPKQWRHVRVTGREKSSLSVDELALNSERFWATVEVVWEIARMRQCLVFGASIAHCCALVAAISLRDVRVEMVSHETPANERNRIIDVFRAGGLDVLVNKNILAAGFDLPRLEDLVLATPIRSAILWEQIVGRISRGPAVGGTAVSRVWELDDHENLHKGVLAAQRFAGDVW